MDKLNTTTELEQNLKELEEVKFVSYEFPGFWVITLQNNKEYLLGNANGNYGWNDSDYILSGETCETNPAKIAKAFKVWLDEINK